MRKIILFLLVLCQAVAPRKKEYKCDLDSLNDFMLDHKKDAAYFVSLEEDIVKVCRDPKTNLNIPYLRIIHSGKLDEFGEVDWADLLIKRKNVLCEINKGYFKILSERPEMVNIELVKEIIGSKCPIWGIQKYYINQYLAGLGMRKDNPEEQKMVIAICEKLIPDLFAAVIEAYKNLDYFKRTRGECNKIPVIEFSEKFFQNRNAAICPGKSFKSSQREFDLIRTDERRFDLEHMEKVGTDDALIEFRASANSKKIPFDEYISNIFYGLIIQLARFIDRTPEGEYNIAWKKLNWRVGIHIRGPGDRPGRGVARIGLEKPEVVPKEPIKPAEEAVAVLPSEPKVEQPIPDKAWEAGVPIVGIEEGRRQRKARADGQIVVEDGQPEYIAPNGQKDIEWTGVLRACIEGKPFSKLTNMKDLDKFAKNFNSFINEHNRSADLSAIFHKDINPASNARVTFMGYLDIFNSWWLCMRIERGSHPVINLEGGVKKQQEASSSSC